MVAQSVQTGWPRIGLGVLSCADNMCLYRSETGECEELYPHDLCAFMAHSWLPPTRYIYIKYVYGIYWSSFSVWLAVSIAEVLVVMWMCENLAESC